MGRRVQQWTGRFSLIVTRVSLGPTLRSGSVPFPAECPQIIWHDGGVGWSAGAQGTSESWEWGDCPLSHVGLREEVWAPREGSGVDA